VSAARTTGAPTAGPATPRPSSLSSPSLGAAALAVAGVMFIAYPAVRPWDDESTVAGAIAAMSSGAWIASHLFGIIGFISVALGLLGLRDLLAPTPAGPTAFAALVTGWIGVGLTLPYYGAEDFALHAMAVRAAGGDRFDLLAMVEEFRFAPVAATTFALGLLALAAGTVLAAVAIWRSGRLPRYSGVPFAVGFALFIPQFYTPAGVRIAHGVLVAVGCLWVALGLWRAGRRDTAR